MPPCTPLPSPSSPSSLPSQLSPSSLPSQLSPLPHEAAASGMFGPSSVLESADAVVYSSSAADESVLFQLLVTALFVMLCVSIRRDVLQAAGRSRRGGRSVDTHHSGAGHRSGAVSCSTIAGLLLVVCAAVKYCGLWLPAGLSGEGSLTALRCAGIALAAAALCAGYQALIIVTAGVVARSHDFAEGLFAIKRNFFSLTALTISPLFVVAALSSSAVWTAILAAECFVLALIFIKETITFFIDKKVPILLWILYLCTVEAFPLTLAVASVARLR